MQSFYCELKGYLMELRGDDLSDLDVAVTGFGEAGEDSDSAAWSDPFAPALEPLRTTTIEIGVGGSLGTKAGIGLHNKVVKSSDENSRRRYPRVLQNEDDLLNEYIDDALDAVHNGFDHFIISAVFEIIILPFAGARSR